MKYMVILFLTHYISDWILQSVEMGRQKSNKFKVLCQHISIIFVSFLLVSLFFLPWYLAIGLSLANALTHAVIDWNIWRMYKRTVVWRNKGVDLEKLKETYKYWLDPVFGAFLGLDYILHVIFIYLIYQPFLNNL